MRSKAEVGESKQGSASSSRLIFLVGTTGDNLERVIRQRSLQRLRLIPRRAHPDVALQDHQYGFGIPQALPTWWLITRNSAMIAAWFVVML